MYFAKLKIILALLFLFVASFLIGAESLDEDATQILSTPKKTLMQYEDEFQRIFDSYCTSIHIGETITKESLKNFISCFLKDHPESKEELRNFSDILHTFDVRYADALSTFTQWFKKLVDD